MARLEIAAGCYRSCGMTLSYTMTVSKVQFSCRV